MIAIEMAFDAEYCFECAEQIKKRDIKYIEKLIRLDRSIIHDKKIAEFIHEKSNNKMISEKIDTARSNGINEK